jgi:hypothetical protein
MLKHGHHHICPCTPDHVQWTDLYVLNLLAQRPAGQCRLSSCWRHMQVIMGFISVLHNSEFKGRFTIYARLVSTA